MNDRVRLSHLESEDLGHQNVKNDQNDQNDEFVGNKLSCGIMHSTSAVKCRGCYIKIEMLKIIPNI